MDPSELRRPEYNTAAVVGRMFSRLSDRIDAGVRAAGHPVRPAHANVFMNIDKGGTRLSNLATKARMTAQAMGELVDELERSGYVERVPDPTDGRAKLIRLTPKGWDAVQAAFDTIQGIEDDLHRRLGPRRLAQLRRTLATLDEDDQLS
jgi:DNA-binding MarR family transcriptional regulator